MKTALKGCFMVAGALLVLVGFSIAVVGPRAAHEGRRFAGPMVTLMGNGQRFGDFISENDWRPPDTVTLTAEQLERFLAVREALDAICARHVPVLSSMPEEPQIETLDEAAGQLQLLSDIVPEQMRAYMEQDMTPAEYRYVKTIVYEQWRLGLKLQGSHPGTLEIAAAELESAAAAEADPAVAARLRERARDLCARPAPPPAGVPPDVHELLLAHREEIERMSLDAYQHLPFPEL